MTTRASNSKTKNAAPSADTFRDDLASLLDRLRPLELLRPSTLILTALYLLLALDHIWVTEDAFITFRSVENLWTGGGPNFNRNIRVESFSHPLWFMILSVLRIGGESLLGPLSACAGVSLATLGLWFATAAALSRNRGVGKQFPLGALMICALPPFWDFASSGLETGLTFCWIGLSSLLVSLALHKQERIPLSTFTVLGLGPLIRIDLICIALPLLATALLLSKTRLHWLNALMLRGCVFLAPALSWEIFRMGYYGLLVPNTYLSKEGLGSRWDQGLIYLHDTYGLYWLYPMLALGLLLAWWAYLKDISAVKPHRNAGLTWTVPLALITGGLIHTLFVTKAGGDFMHARLLLPGIFALLTAFAWVRLPKSRHLSRACVAVSLAWALTTGLTARPRYAGHVSKNGIADERMYYVNSARISHPISASDYRFHNFYRIGEELRYKARAEKVSAFYWAHIGIAISVLPNEVIVIDPLTLNDYVGSHTILTKRGRPGHEKIARAAWFLARYPAGTGLVINQQLEEVFKVKELPEAIEAARAALATPLLRELSSATTDPMTPALFIRNIFRAWRLTTLRFPNDPVEAVRTLSDEK